MDRECTKVGGVVYFVLVRPYSSLLVLLPTLLGNVALYSPTLLSNVATYATQSYSILHTIVLMVWLVGGPMPRPRKPQLQQERDLADRWLPHSPERELRRALHGTSRCMLAARDLH